MVRFPFIQFKKMSRPKTSTILLLLVSAAGCASKVINPQEVNPAIAANFREFYDNGISKPAVAEKALNEAAKADPDDAYTGYLRASLSAQKLDFEKALEQVSAANKQKRVIIYIEEPMPGGSVQSLTRIRQLGFSVDKAASLGSKLPQYFTEIRTMGVRVANAIPINSLAVLNGTGVIKKSYQSEIAFYEKAKDTQKLAQVKSEFQEFTKWRNELNAVMASTTKDFVREAAKAAGMTAEELALYSDGHELKDKEKQKKADETRLKIYQDEVNALQRALKTLPVMKS